MTGEDRLFLYGSLGASLLLHLLSAFFFWRVQIPDPSLQDSSPLMVRLLRSSEVPHFIDQPNAPRATRPVKSQNISQVTAEARGPGKVPGPVTTSESSGTPNLPKALPPPEVAAVSRPVSPPALRRQPSIPPTSTPQSGKESQVRPRPAPSLNRSAASPEVRPSLREQIAALRRRELSRDGGGFDPGERGETGTGERTVSLETQSSEYAPYLGVLKRRIERHWRIPPYARAIGLTGKLVLVFSINREGDLTQVEISKSSGVSILDEAAVAAVKGAAPYTPFPPRFAIRRLNIIAGFDYVGRAVPGP